jgi:hypothetical protein
MKEKDFNKTFGDLPPEYSSNESRQELGDIKRIYDILINDTEPDPPESMDTRFYEMLENEALKSGNKKFGTIMTTVTSSAAFRRALNIAAGIALFIAGWLGASFSGNSGNNKQITLLTNELSDLKESLVLTMMKQSSPVERIQAVTMVTTMDEVDSEITSSLLSVLSYDPNDNVRLAALETLAEYADIPEVREGLIRSISHQQSPLIQIRLAELMLALEEKRSVEEFRKILSDITLDYNVRTRLTETIEVLL